MMVKYDIKNLVLLSCIVVYGAATQLESAPSTQATTTDHIEKNTQYYFNSNLYMIELCWMDS